MAALAAVQKQLTDLKNAVYYMTEKTGAAQAGTAGAGGGASEDVVAALEAVSKELKETTASVKALSERVGYVSEVVSGLKEASASIKALGDQVGCVAKMSSDLKETTAAVKALGDQVGYVARISSDGFSSIKGATDKIAAVPTPQQINEVAEKVDSFSKKLQAIHQIAEVSKKADAISDNVGYVARQSSELLKKLDEMEKKGADTEKGPESAGTSEQVAALAAKVDGLSGQLKGIASSAENQRKQAELMPEALALVTKELNTATAAYSDLSKKLGAVPAAQQFERLAAAAAKMTENQAVQEKRLAGLADSLALVLKQLADSQASRGAQQNTVQLSDQLSRLSGQLTRLTDAADAQKNQTEIIASALTSIVKQVSTLERAVLAMPKYPDIEKRVMGRLAEKMAGQ